MGDIPDDIFIVPLLKEDVYGMGIAGPPVDGVEEEKAQNVIEEETSKTPDENIGKNVDIKA